MQQTENINYPSINQHDVYTIEYVIVANALRPHICNVKNVREFEWDKCLQPTNLNERVPNSQRGIQNVTLRSIG